MNLFIPCVHLQRLDVLQERLSLLERQMHLITELAASEFTILSLTEELEDAHANTTLLQEENALLMSECGLLQDVVPSQVQRRLDRFTSSGYSKSLSICRNCG